QLDVSWTGAARKYVEVYKALVEERPVELQAVFGQLWLLPLLLMAMASLRKISVMEFEVTGSNYRASLLLTPERQWMTVEDDQGRVFARFTLSSVVTAAWGTAFDYHGFTVISGNEIRLRYVPEFGKTTIWEMQEISIIFHED